MCVWVHTYKHKYKYHILVCLHIWLCVVHFSWELIFSLVKHACMIHASEANKKLT